MDSLYNNSKIPKLKLKLKPKPSNGNVSPLNADSPLMKYLRSKSPMATDSFSSPSPMKHQYSSSSSSSGGGGGGNSRGSSEKTPLSEDVFVMDGILIGSGHGSRGLRSGSDLKLEICRAWEDFGHCRFASKCQFAHGKEELHPTRFPIKNKSEAQLCKLYTSVGSCPYGSKCRFVHHIMPEAAAATQMVSPNIHEQTSKSPRTITKLEYTSKTPTSTIKSEHTSKTSSFCSSCCSPSTPSTTTKPEHTSKTPTSTIKSQHTSKTPSSSIKPKLASKSPGTAIKLEDSCKTPITPITSRDWSPFDDGIEVALPSHTEELPSREETDAHIDNILYGPARKKRLQVFAQIFPE